MECNENIDGSIFMLHDQPYCSADCRLQACRREAEGKPALSRAPSAQSMVSSASSTGLLSSFPSWM